MPELPYFPASGILQFYVSVSDDVCGLDFEDQCGQTGFSIKYFEHIAEGEAELVDDFSFVQVEEDDDFLIQSEAAITPELSVEWVLPSDFQFEQFDEDVYDEYTESGFGHKIGGYVFFTQVDPR